ncbi:MAG: class I SAM-dependent methyltransferase [Phycisphaerae bacterium]|nr:class I SAM-dependent methyltransferase [Phycisphaerae bacterium]
MADNEDLSRRTEQALQCERDWHEKGFYVDFDHWTSRFPFASRERHWLSVDAEKIRFYGYLARFIRSAPYRGKAKALLAPIGSGWETGYLKGLCDSIHGIDISPLALSQCPRHVVTREGDIRASGYPSATFDIVVCPLFLHHVHKVGFDPFVKEFFRILRPGGVLAVQEPNRFFLPNVATRCLRAFLGNVTELVPDERPVNPAAITRCLRQAGFTRVRSVGLSISHVRYPVVLQAVNLMIDVPFRRIWPLTWLCNGIGWFCEKK